LGFGTTIAQGLIGGASGAGSMTAFRMAARRIGWIDITPPQATRDWLTASVGLQAGGVGTRQLLDSVVHLAVGLAGGAAYSCFMLRMPRSVLSSGALFGFGVWALAFGVLAPRLGITASPRRGTWRETAVNVAAHLLYGTATALVARELRRQTHAADAGPRAWRARVG
jgi:uncharacterized membrane protein YagU involved in acid resistance